MDISIRKERDSERIHRRGEKRGERGCQGRVVGGIHLYGITVLTNHYHASPPDLIRSENGFMTQLFIRLEKIAH